MTAAPLLTAASAAVIGTLGGIHLLYTYRGTKLDPRDPEVKRAMERTTYVLTRQTTVWRATQGFNASHSLGLILYALVWGHLALWRPELLHASPFLSALGLAVLLAYAVLARRHFFSVPLRGVALACVLYMAGWVLA